jgi:glycosyltransferase involved in cell wall biosynthesis
LIDRFSLPPGEIILATLSYLKPHKNIDTVIEACGQLGKRGVSVRLFVIGEGPMRNKLEALCKGAGIADRVQWLGHISDPVPILQACDIFLMVSLGEGFGLALAEAMACGAACVAADSGALREIVEHGTSGLLVTPRDSTALADAVEKLARNEELRCQMGRLAVERVRRHFALETSIEEMIKSYQLMWSSLDRPH